MLCSRNCFFGPVTVPMPAGSGGEGWRAGGAAGGGQGGGEGPLASQGGAALPRQNRGAHRLHASRRTAAALSRRSSGHHAARCSGVSSLDTAASMTRQILVGCLGGARKAAEPVFSTAAARARNVLQPPGQHRQAVAQATLTVALGQWRGSIASSRAIRSNPRGVPSSLEVRQAR